MQKSIMTSAVAALVTLFGTPVLADVSARASITGFGYRLVDLRPGDGIAPAISFNSPTLINTEGTFAATNIEENATPFDLFDFESRFDRFRTFKPMHVEAATPTVEAAARLSGLLARREFKISAEGSLLNSSTNVNAKQFGATAVSSEQGGHVFEVTPFTRVIFTGMASINARRTTLDSSILPEIGRASFISGIDTGPASGVHIQKEVEVNPENSLMQNSFSERLRVSYENRTAARTSGDLYLTVQVDGFAGVPRRNALLQPAIPMTTVSPVPESGTATLMLGGLAVIIGLMRTARRRVAEDTVIKNFGPAPRTAMPDPRTSIIRAR